MLTYESDLKPAEMRRDQPTSTSELCIWPSLLPEESLWGYRERLFILNGARQLHALRQLSCSQSCRYTAPIFPKGLDAMLQSLPGPFCNVEQLARATTVLPLMDWVFSRAQVESLVNRLATGKSIAPFIQEMGHARAFPRHCPACAKEDEAAYGFPYWRRLHQIGLVAVCPEHSVPLLAGCGSCAMKDLGPASSRLPSQICACGRPQRPVIAGEDEAHLGFLLRLSKLADAMLTTKCPEELGDKSGHAVAHAFVARGYVARGAPSAARLRDELSNAGELAVLKKLGMRECVSDTFLRMTKGLGSTSLGVRLTVIDRLFGSFDNYMSACKTTTPFTLPSRKLQPISSDELEDSRAKVQDYITVHPKAMRIEVAKAVGRHLDVLRLHDRKWLDENVPKATKTRNPISISRARRIAALDAEIAEHIEARATELRALASQPRRLCDASLLVGYRYAVRPNLGPLAIAALDQHTESIEEFRLRSINWAITVHEGFRDEHHRKRFIECRLTTGSNGYAHATRLVAAGKPVTLAEVTIRPTSRGAAKAGAPRDPSGGE